MRSLPENGRKSLQWMAGGGEEREGRAGPPGVEGVGPRPAVGTRPGAWTPVGVGQRLPTEKRGAGSR